VKQFRETPPRYGFHQFLFPIVQGSTYPDLRRKSAETISTYDAEGYAIGGLSVGEPEALMYEMTSVVNAVLPARKARYLMGVGTPANILESIALGIDMFDCVMPTRNGRNGMLFTANGIINIKNQKWKNDFSSLDDSGHLPFGQDYSKAYLRHLIISKEMLGAQVASMHNLCFYLWLMRESRAHILQGTFKSWKDRMIPKLKSRL
jgi:queuine tRNA-ribosyltransferase